MNKIVLNYYYHFLELGKQIDFIESVLHHLRTVILQTLACYVAGHQ